MELKQVEEDMITELKQKIKNIMELKNIARRRYDFETKVENEEDYGTKVARRRYDYGTKVYSQKKI